MKHLSLPRLLVAFLTVMPAMSVAAQAPKPPAMQKVLGIGGLFFKSEHPAELSRWYEKYLGVAPVPTSDGQKSWQQQAGPTAFAPFKKNTTYFGKTDHGWMIDFRVADLKAMVAQLRAAGITVDEPKTYPNGSFARLHDPEGNPIELWQPKDAK